MNENNNRKIKVIITGATGMVGEGVLNECLLSDKVEQVLVVGRKSCGVSHPKLKEMVVSDFFDLFAVGNPSVDNPAGYNPAIASQLSGYNACYFCLGVSSLSFKGDEYYKITYTLTMGFAGMVSALNPDMTFCYVAGAGTDGTEKGSITWARVKGKTENDLTKLPFKQVFNYRPGFINPTKGLKNALSFYKYITWMYPVMRKLFPGGVSTLKELGLSMINVTLNGYNKTVLDVKDIVKSAAI